MSAYNKRKLPEPETVIRELRDELQMVRNQVTLLQKELHMVRDEVVLVKVCTRSHTTHTLVCPLFNHSRCVQRQRENLKIQIEVDGQHYNNNLQHYNNLLLQVEHCRMDVERRQEMADELARGKVCIVFSVSMLSISLILFNPSDLNRHGRRRKLLATE